MVYLKSRKHYVKMKSINQQVVYFSLEIPVCLSCRDGQPSRAHLFNLQLLAPWDLLFEIVIP